ncbi:MAG: hypothetical protein KGZ82_03640 [Bacteroidales bacterium]|nr:hypothetical protein [Bacteroidales bacterium]
MENKTLVTYSLLTHLKETRVAEYSSIVELFFPIVKKAIVEYANEHGYSNVKGKSISEIQAKITEFFGIDIPLGVLDFILSQINKEISDDKIFAYYQDKSYIINTFVFGDIDEEILKETTNIELLQSDYEKFCSNHEYEPDFEELIKFICSQKLELFANKKKDDFDFSFHIPKYISLKFEDEKFYKIISDIYLGSLISSYFEFKISTPVSNTELLIDTNFFISLIDLNTYEAFLTCTQLFEICNRLGYKFTILYSTIEQIKVLLSTRLQDFANKDIGLVKEADVFGACIRRNLDKTQLERIKDNVDKYIRDFDIEIIHESRIKDLITKAKKSEKYKEILELRNYQQLSALNDTIAFFYVNQKRGTNIHEFADAKCWFLNNTFHSDYYIGLGYKLHERYKISANELLSLLWLANPNQVKFDIHILSKGGLATYIAKYRQLKTPSINTIKDISARAKQAMQDGQLSEKDVFRISIRMSEGQLTNGEATELANLPDDDFIESVKELSKKDEEILTRIDKQTETIDKQNELLERLSKQNTDNQFNLAVERFEREKDKYVEKEIPLKILGINKIAWGYIVFVIIVLSLWLLNYLKFKILGNELSGILSFILFAATLFIRFVEHKTVLKCLRFTFSPNYRAIALSEYRESYENEYNKNNKRPTREMFEQ